MNSLVLKPYFRLFPWARFLGMKITVSKGMNVFKVLNTHPENAFHKHAHFPRSPSALNTLNKPTLLIATPFPEVSSLRIELKALSQNGDGPTGRTYEKAIRLWAFLSVHSPSLS